MDEISFALTNPIGAAILTVLGWALVAFQVAHRPDQASGLADKASPLNALSQALEPLTLWPAFAMAAIGTAALVIQGTSWALSSLLEKHEASLWAEYGSHVKSADIARVQASAKLVAACAVIAITSIIIPFTAIQNRAVLIVASIGPLTLLPAVIWWIAQTYKLHKLAERHAFLDATTSDSYLTPIARPQPVHPVVPEINASPAEEIFDLPAGSIDWIETSHGRIRATRCVTGTLRLYWPPNTALMERAKVVVAGRAEYNKAHHAWFVFRPYERAVLRDLAEI
mgnify:CR=1 FL=1